MIKPILNRYLSADEFYTLSKNIKASIASSSIDETFKEKLMARIDKELSKFEAALNQVQKNPKTIKKEQADDHRDNLFVGLRTATEAITYHWDKDKQEAAHQLMEIIRRHGYSLQTEGYAIQSAGINALINELEQESAAAYIQVIGTQQWLKHLIDAQRDFEKVEMESDKFDAQQKPLITSTRKALYKDLSATLNFMESQAEFNASIELSQLIDNINQVIIGITSSARARNTRKHTA